MTPFPTTGTAAAEPETAERIRDVNTRYHDGAAAHYDAKWGIDWGDVGRDQVLGKLEKLLGRPLPRFERSLEIGAGTGYITLHLLRAGIVADATATDISPGMVDALRGNAERLGLTVDARVADAERLPFDDESFDLVCGHAVLHHIPDLDRAFAELHRVLRPGGVVLFAGEPSRNGDRIAVVPKRSATLLAPVWRRAIGARPAERGHDDGGEENHELEHLVDVHAFVPDELRRPVEAAGFADVRVQGEELAANWFGWFNRALETTARREDVPLRWQKYAFHGYLLFQRLDRRLLEGRLPAGIFYNLMVVGRKAADGERPAA
ncbi:MAG: class I SAM-dependent methyltransferase [Solirubrobacteraceae bacterium]|nr:class I SAM-dependent methyltransferase [Solirubrobacteraceae bacterium]